MASPTKHDGEDSVDDDNGVVRGNKRSILDTSLDKMIVDGQSLSEEEKDFIKKTRRFAQKKQNWGSREARCGY